MAAVSGEFAAVAKEELNWFKIDASGLIDDTTVPGNWATDVMMANNLTSTVTIPSDIAAGNYVIRHEIIALHSAGQEDGAQSYPQCKSTQSSKAYRRSANRFGQVSTSRSLAPALLALALMVRIVLLELRCTRPPTLEF